MTLKNEFGGLKRRGEIYVDRQTPWETPPHKEGRQTEAALPNRSLEPRRATTVSLNRENTRGLRWLSLRGGIERAPDRTETLHRDERVPRCVSIRILLTGQQFSASASKITRHLFPNRAVA